MRPESLAQSEPQPQTRTELQALDPRPPQACPLRLESALLSAIDVVFSRHERLWQESKQEAIQALSSGFADKMARVKNELSAKDATVSSISRYFEQLVADLTDKSHRDPKTKLMNFGRFTEQLESFLALEQRGRWCAVGLVDITGFKWYNDALGHAVGDQIIERVAHLLREQVRSDDLIAQERRGQALEGSSRALRRRRVLLPHPGSRRVPRRRTRSPSGSAKPSSATTGRSRIIGSPCSRCASTSASSACGSGAWPIAGSSRGGWRPRLIQRADKLMYEAKGERASHIYLVRQRVVDGELVDLTDADPVSESSTSTRSPQTPSTDRSPC